MKKQFQLGILMVSLFVLSIECSFCQTNNNNDFVKTAKTIDQYVLESIKNNEPGGVVLVVKDGNIIYKRAYGMANMELGVKMKSDMVFNIGSLTKQFTAVATMMLVEDGKLSLDDNIQKFLPDFPLNNQKILIRHLLSHTSGIKNYLDTKEFYDNIRQDLSSEDILKIIKKQPLQFNPGEQNSYSNSNYVLLGSIIEKASGMSYATFIFEKIIKQLQLKNTQLINNEKIIPGLVNGYEKTNDIIKRARMMSWSYLYADGGLSTNAEDLAKWNNAVINHELISQESLTQCLTSQKLNDGSNSINGFGWFVDTLYGRKYVYHGGGIFGYVNHTLYLPQEKIYVAVLRNCLDRLTDTRHIAEAITGIILGEYTPITSTEAIEFSQDELENYAGNYQFEDNSIRRIMLIGTKLYYGTGPERKIELIPESKSRFHAPGNVITVEFIFNDAGDVVEIISSAGDRSKKGTKK